MTLEEPRMNTNEHELILKEEVFDVVGCAMEVLNELGHGLLEKPYEDALVVELGLKNISTQQQSRYKLMYKYESEMNTNTQHAFY